MKITHIEIQHVLGAQSINIDLPTPVTVFCGANGMGKSSIAEAVRMALTCDPLARGVALKKELGALVTEGHKAGMVSVAFDGREAFVMLPTGKTTATAEYTPHPALPYVLDAQNFARLDAKGRRAFLFGLMGLKLKPADIVARLIAKGCDKDRSEKIGAFLVGGMEAGATEAAAKARDAKASWKTVTGEAYGDVKAATWKAEVPAFNADTLAAEIARLNEADGDLSRAQQALGALESDKRRQDEARSRLNGLQQQAGTLERLKIKLAADEKNLAEAEQALKAGQDAAGTAPRVGLIHDLARAVHFLVGVYGGDLYEHADVLERYETEFGAVNAERFAPDSGARVPALIEARDLMQSAVANTRRDIARAEAAAAQVKTIEDELKATPVDGAAVEKAQQDLATLRGKKASQAAVVDRLRAAKAAAEAAQKKTDDATRLHADVAAWQAIGAQLAPDGIPGEILAEALNPINDLLASYAREADWMRIAVNQDMTIATGLHDRPFNLLSESEQWRANAMIAAAISTLSGVRLLMLDRIDCLDLKGRGDLFYWIDGLVEDGSIDTALLFGTLKALPTGLSEFARAYWVEAGSIKDAPCLAAA